MAIVNNGTINALKGIQIPAGYVRPTVTPVVGPHYKRSLTILVPKATVEVAARNTTMTAIIENAAVGITKQVSDILAADYLATATVTSHTKLLSITTNLEGTKGTDELFSDTVINYICEVIIYVKAE